MTTPAHASISARLTAAAGAALLTLVMLAGVEGLATSEPSPALLAHVQGATAKG